MIETREQYEMLKRVLGPPYPTDIQEEEFAAFIETIEALREVARASKHHAAKGYANSQNDWRFVVLEKLDALPDWITNE